MRFGGVPRGMTDGEAPSRRCCHNHAHMHVRRASWREITHLSATHEHEHNHPACDHDHEPQNRRQSTPRGTFNHGHPHRSGARRRERPAQSLWSAHTVGRRLGPDETSPPSRALGCAHAGLDGGAYSGSGAGSPGRATQQSREAIGHATFVPAGRDRLHCNTGGVGRCWRREARCMEPVWVGHPLRPGYSRRAARTGSTSARLDRPAAARFQSWLAGEPVQVG
jgi:hypothetical protein